MPAGWGHHRGASGHVLRPAQLGPGPCAQAGRHPDGVRHRPGRVRRAGRKRGDRGLHVGQDPWRATWPATTMQAQQAQAGPLAAEVMARVKDITAA